MRLSVDQVVRDLSLMNLLREFDPVLIGTPPLKISVDTSDIDVACSSDDLQRFLKVAAQAFGDLDRFQSRQITAQDFPALVVQFRALGWDVELFCQSLPTGQQWGVRHFQIERKILQIDPTLRDQVRRLKSEGLKTEPAFAKALALNGDPYRALLELENLSEDELRQCVLERSVPPSG